MKENSIGETIKHSFEKIADKFEEESKKYQQIKPETDTTIEEVKNFWDGVFTCLELS